MEIREGKLTHIGETIIIKSQPQVKNLTELPSVGKLSKKPPFVTPNRYPDEIISEHFDYQDRETFIDTIINKQRTGAEWDHIRAKLPEVFLDKIKRVLKDCWQNGFCNPHVSEGKLKWSQIKGQRVNQFPEQCDLCRNTTRAGDCKGRMIYFTGKRDYKKCWER